MPDGVLDSLGQYKLLSVTSEIPNQVKSEAGNVGVRRHIFKVIDMSKSMGRMLTERLQLMNVQ